MTCKFCEDYKELREMLENDGKMLENDGKMPGNDGKMPEEKQARRKSKFVAVLREDIEKGGCVSYGSYDLNYCPSCGERLKENKVCCRRAKR